MKRIRLSFSVLITLLVMLAVISCGGGGGGGGGAVGKESTGNNNGTKNSSISLGNTSTTLNQELNDYIYFTSRYFYLNNANYGGTDVVRPQILIFDGKGTANTDGKAYIISGLSSKIDGVSPAEILSDCQNHVTAIVSTSKEVGTCSFGHTSTSSTWVSNPYIFIAGSSAKEGEGFYIINPSENTEQTWTAIREDGILYLFAEPGNSYILNLHLSANDYALYRQTLLLNDSIFAKNPDAYSYAHLTPEERKTIFIGGLFEIPSSQKIKLDWFINYSSVGGGNTYNPTKTYFAGICRNFEQMKASILYRESNPFGDIINYINAPQEALYILIEANFPYEDLSKLAELLKTYSRDVCLEFVGNQNMLTIPTNMFRDCICIKNVLFCESYVTIEANAFPDATIITSHL